MNAVKWDLQMALLSEWVYEEIFNIVVSDGHWKVSPTSLCEPRSLADMRRSNSDQTAKMSSCPNV